MTVKRAFFFLLTPIIALCIMYAITEENLSLTIFFTLLGYMIALSNRPSL